MHVQLPPAQVPCTQVTLQAIGAGVGVGEGVGLGGVEVPPSGRQVGHTEQGVSGTIWYVGKLFTPATWPKSVVPTTGKLKVSSMGPMLAARSAANDVDMLTAFESQFAGALPVDGSAIST